jgi:ribosome-associated translation inhibitor RaiA
MKIQFHIHGLNMSASSRRWLEQALEQLRRRIPVKTAAVVLVHQREATPAFHAFVHLAVPGPDIHADVREHTLEAVWLKVTAALRRQVEQRESRRRARVKSKRQMPLTTSRWGGGMAGARV